MFKHAFLVTKKFFGLKVNNRKLMTVLIFTAVLRSTSVLLLPFASAKIVGFADVADYDGAVRWAAIFLFAGLFHVLCHHLNFYAYSRYCNFANSRLQTLVLDKISTYDRDFSESVSASFIVNTADKDIGTARRVPDEFFDAVAKLCTLVTAFAILLHTNLLIGLLALSLGAFSALLFNYNIKKKEYYTHRQRADQDNISELIGQAIDGHKEIKSFNIESDLNDYLDDYKERWHGHFLKKRHYLNIIEVSLPALLAFGEILIYLIAINLIIQGRYDISTLVLIIGYYGNIQTEFASFTKHLKSISNIAPSVDRLHDLLNYKTRHMQRFGNNNTDDISGKIDFDDVSFSHNRHRIIKNLSFSVPPHSFTAIVGRSGSGKSTIFSLLLRLYKASSGKILIDDRSIYRYSRAVYPRNVAIVTQRPFLFDMSIRENLNLVDPDRENQISACKKAGIHNYIISLKDGYNTKLLNNAANLSGGQKQLLALARTLLSRAEILLFDEATASLDLSASQKIVEILQKLKKDHTVIMITHKPELMCLADRILVINRGRLVGQGTHKQLLRSNKYYRQLQKP